MAKKGYKSRAGKKNQRKNTDISDVEAYLEEKAHERLVTGGLAEEKENEQLFVVDKQRDTEIKPMSKKEYWRNKKLKSDQILEGNPFVKPIGVQKNKSNKLEKKALEKKINNIIRNQEKHKNQRSTQKEEKETVPKDIWGAKEPEIVVKKRKTLNLDENTFLHDVRSKQYKNPSGKPEAVDRLKNKKLPQPGMSYNPSYEDHQDQLGVALAQAIRDEKKKKRIEMQIRPRKDVEQNINGSIQILKRGEDPESDDQQDHDEDGDSSDYEMKPHVNVPHVDRKTQKQLKKEEKKKRMAEEQIQEQNAKKISEDIEKVDELTKQIEEKEKSRKLRREIRKSNAPEIDMDVPAPLRNEPVQVLLTEELPGSLRKLGVKYDPLKDQLVQFQKTRILNLSNPNKKPQRKHPTKLKNKRNMDDVRSLLPKEL